MLIETCLHGHIAVCLHRGIFKSTAIITMSSHHNVYHHHRVASSYHAAIGHHPHVISHSLPSSPPGTTLSLELPCPYPSSGKVSSIAKLLIPVNEWPALLNFLQAGLSLALVQGRDRAQEGMVWPRRLC